MRVVDVECGPGGLTVELAARLGAANVAAIDPASQFVSACRERIPGADVREGGMTMLHLFWTAVRRIEPGAQGEQRRAGTTEGDIAERFARAGLEDVVDGTLEATADYADFDDFWEPFLLSVGPAGHYLASLTEERRVAVREALRADLPDGPFSLTARAWYAKGTV